MKMALKLDFHDYWHIGSGEGKGSHLDAVVDLDSQALPYVPGKMLKGLLRDAATRAAAWQWPGHDTQWVERVFGSENTRDKTEPGCIRVSDARLPVNVANYLAQHKTLAAGLYDELFSTAIDEKTGTAKQGSLRGMQVVVPLQLLAEIEFEKGQPDDAKRVKELLPLISAIGANKTRGLGRVTVGGEEASGGSQAENNGETA